MPAWMLLGVAAMAFATLHILVDFGIGLFDLHGQLSTAETLLLVVIALIRVVGDLLRGRCAGRRGGVASVAVLALSWRSSRRS
jgi:hypothetical protein